MNIILILLILLTIFKGKAKLSTIQSPVVSYNIAHLQAWNDTSSNGFHTLWL